MKILFTFLAAFMLVSFISCSNKSEEINYSKDNIYPGLDTLRYSKGSYWIYQNQLTHSFDSVYVDQTLHSHYTVELIGGVGIIREYYKMLLKSSLGKEEILWIEGLRMVQNPTTIYPYADGPVLYSADTTFDWQFGEHTFYDSLRVNGHVYRKVQKTLAGDGTYCYVCEESGIIKRTKNDQIWDLVRCSLVR
ncbi:MAG: hypothetical protein ACM3N9_02760 [Syntrophothermus sp.]